jgi:tRNA-splicing ligase RtcB (3'-phosphate/5'-hydroxy nucleic acid ligase)
VSAPLHAFVSERLDPEVARFVERVRHADDVVHVAVMPDVHLAGRACVGTVVATTRSLYPVLLGSDLGCGVAVIPLGAPRSSLEDPALARRALEVLSRAVPILRRASPLVDTLPPPPSPALARLFEKEGSAELGTLGRGNHFVELRGDESGELHLVVHSGSRAMGPAIQAHHERLARPGRLGFAALEAESDEGMRYLADVDWALTFAASNRSAIARAGCEALGDLVSLSPQQECSESVDCQHDSVLGEVHAGARCWVHRKGAIALPDGARGVIPGSMGTDTYLVRGRGDPRSLGSSAHGAGRALPRGQARRVIDVARLSRELEGVVYDEAKRKGLLDEAPSAYKDLRHVMRAQRELVAITGTLTPFIVHKGA